MTIRREDLAAAAAVGLLHYTQIDPLLVYLLQCDVRAKREAMLAQLSRRSRFNLWLSYAAGLLALITAALFAVLFVSRAMMTMDTGALFLSCLLYGSGTLAFAGWLRKCGFCMRVLLATALTLASVPIAVFALCHVPR